MANFQQAIQKFPAKGLPGSKASLNPVVYTDRNYLASGDTVTIGKFVWGDNIPVNSSGYTGSGIWHAKNSGTGLPLGIVEHSLSYVNPDIFSAATMVVPEFSRLQIVVRGDLYAVATTAATVGQKVFATLADGSIQTGAAGATIAGAVETSWSVKEGAAAGELITISNWSA